MNQIELHKEIERLVLQSPKSVEVDYVSKLITANEDAKQYFYSKAGQKWLSWLWENGLLDVIKKKAADSNSYGFRMPELSYLFSMTEKSPQTVSKIICSFKINKSNFNPEVVDQFTRIAGVLPAKQLKNIVRKMRDEKWLSLMGSYTQYGFEYADMFEKFQKAKDTESILALSEAVLSIRSRAELKKRKHAYRSDNKFYIRDLGETKIFEYLVNVPNSYQEQALSVTLDAFAEAIKDGGDYQLLDVDFFTLSLKDVSDYSSYREDLKSLAATVITLFKQVFEKEVNNKKDSIREYLEELPDNRTAHRLKLFILSINPELFVEDLRNEYFRLFEAEKVLEVLYGAEYERSMIAGFEYLDEKSQEKYQKKALALFGKHKDEDEKRWHLHYGSCIFSVIAKTGKLSKSIEATAKLKGFKIDTRYEPEPTIGKTRGGTVVPRSPLTEKDFSSLSIEEISKKLADELSPEELKKKYSKDDFLNPRDADGVAEQLKSDIKNRLSEYLDNATLFFRPGKLIPHYTNAYLRGVKEALAENRSEGKKLKYKELFELLSSIKEFGEEDAFAQDKIHEGRWLSNWNSVHLSICDLLEELIKVKDKTTLINFKEYKPYLLGILKYLFNYNDPIPEDEKQKTAKMTVKDPGESEYSISDPFSIAINSVRGRAFQVLIRYIHQDASNFENISLSDEVKALVLSLLKVEKTRAIMFMFGHYLPSFYFRDAEWIESKIKDIFAIDSKDKYLRLAAWEGYLSNNLYREIFFDKRIQNLYRENLTLDLKYPNQKFFKDPHESIAIHFALAFVHYKEFGLKNQLLKEFLDKASVSQLSEFISFIGRAFISGSDSAVLKDKDSSWRVDRMKSFWNLMLESGIENAVLEKFGTWINVKNGVFDNKWLAKRIKQTLESTNGTIEWDYGLVKSIEGIAESSAEDTLDILEKHFLSIIENEKSSFPIYADKEWYKAFEILYNSEDEKIKNETTDLISELIEKGGKQFWSLESIVRT